MTAPTGAADSAGLPWAGRHLVATGFADDDGTPDPKLLALLERPGPSGSDDETALLALLARARLLVPLVAAPPSADPPSADPASDGPHEELSGVTLVAPDGQRALPAFTGLPALAAWDGAARPVPVTARDAARAAVEQGCAVLVLDPRSPSAIVLRPSMLAALAEGRPWVPAHRDPVVTEPVAGALASELAVVSHALGPGPPGGDAVVLTVRLRAGLAAGEVHELTSRVARRLGADLGLRSRVDDLVLRIEAAGQE